MTTTKDDDVARITQEEIDVEATIAENIATLLHRTRMSASGVARELHMSRATLNRKLLGAGPWSFYEVQALCAFFCVTLDEMSGSLPPGPEWHLRWQLSPAGLREPQRACRDSNPKPSVLCSARVGRGVARRAVGRLHGRPRPRPAGVNLGFTVNRRADLALCA